MKSVNILISNLSNGGTQKVCVNIIDALVKYNYRVNLIVLNLDEQYYTPKISSNLSICNLRISRVRYSFFKLYQIVKKNNCEKYLVFDYDMAMMLVFVKLITRTNFPITARNMSVISNTISSEKKPILRVFRKFLFSYLYSKIDFVVNQSKRMQDDLVFSLNTFKIGKNTAVINNPVDTLIYNFAKNNINVNFSKKKYFLIIGRLEKVKGIDYAINAFEIFHKKYSDYKLIICGNGSLKDDLINLINKKKLSNSIQILSHTNNVIPLYIYAKATLLTSHYEGYPNVIIESICLKTPVIAFDCPFGPAEILKIKNWGVLVPLYDIDSMALAMESVINNFYNFDDFNTAVDLFSMDKYIIKLNDILQTVK